MPDHSFDDAPLETLFLPILDARLRWPQDGALFLRARDGWPLRQRPLPGLVCEQSFKPDAEALQRSGFEVLQSPASAEDGKKIRTGPGAAAATAR